MYETSISTKDIEKFISRISPVIVDTVGVEKSLRIWLISMGVRIEDKEEISIIAMLKAKRANGE